MTSNFAWNPIECAPKDINEPILALTNNNKLIVFKDTKTFLGGDIEHPFSDWKNIVDKYKIKLWVYQSEVINSEYYDEPYILHYNE